MQSLKGLPKAIRTDNGKQFCGPAILNCAHSKGVKLFLIESDKANPNAYIESFNRRFRDECLNEYWFTSMAHGRVIGEALRRATTSSPPRNPWAN